MRTVSESPPDGGPVSGTESTSSAHRIRARRLSVTGGVIGTAAAWWSVLPSLVPRAWLMQVLLTALCLSVFYGIGAFVGWAYRKLQLPDLPASWRRGAWMMLAVVAPLGLLVAGWFGRQWQLDQRALIAMEPSVPWLWVVAPFLGVVIAFALLAVCRGIRWLGRNIAALLAHLLPSRFATAVAACVTLLAIWYLVSGVFLGHAITVADSIFANRNDAAVPGVENPDSPYRSGGPSSNLSWDDLGREGRQFIWQGRTAGEIAEVTGDSASVEPVRAFVDLGAAPTATERAQIAVDELRRLGGFERASLAIAGGTGSGWIDPRTASALEFVAHGDVATVTMQYSYLPSWLSFLVDKERAQTNAEELITAVRVELDRMPADERPDLYVYGESLGTFSTDSAFTSVEDLSTTTDGALLVGPPSFDTTWQRVQAGRDPDSPLWQPNYDDGALVRVANDEASLFDPAFEWQTDNRIVYLVNSSDPIVGWTANHTEWLDPRGSDVMPQVSDLPLLSYFAFTVDQFGANSPPAGHGHVYGDLVVPAWSEILGPPSLPDAEIEDVKAAVSQIEDPD